MSPKVTIIIHINTELLVSDIKKTKTKYVNGFYPDWVNTHFGRLDESENCIHDMMKKAVFHTIKAIEISKDEIFYIKYNELSSNRNVRFELFFSKDSAHLLEEFTNNLAMSTSLFRRWASFMMSSGGSDN